jgi:hypothetical protein
MKKKKFSLLIVDYNQTSLKPFIDLFARFVQRVQTSKQDEVLAKSGSFDFLFFSFL